MMLTSDRPQNYPSYRVLPSVELDRGLGRAQGEAPRAANCANALRELVGVRPFWVTARAACFSRRAPFSRSLQSVFPRSQCRGALVPSWHDPQADRFWATEGGDSFLCPS